MPVYDYKCPQHGIFNELVIMAESENPQQCPQCGNLSARIIVLAPRVREISEQRLRAFETNERSANAPIVSSCDQRQHDKLHRQTCGCGSAKKQRQMIFTADGGKTFPSARPWMISH